MRYDTGSRYLSTGAIPIKKWPCRKENNVKICRKLSENMSLPTKLSLRKTDVIFPSCRRFDGGMEVPWFYREREIINDGDFLPPWNSLLYIIGNFRRQIRPTSCFNHISILHHYFVHRMQFRHRLLAVVGITRNCFTDIDIRYNIRNFIRIPSRAISVGFFHVSVCISKLIVDVMAYEERNSFLLLFYSS